MSALATNRVEANRLLTTARSLANRILSDDDQSVAQTAVLGVRLAVTLRELDAHIIDSAIVPIEWNFR